MKENIGNLLENWLMNLGMSMQFAEITSVIIIIISLTIASFVADFITRKVLLAALHTVIRRTKTLWDDILLEKKVFNKIAHIAPAILVYYTIDWAFPTVPKFTAVLEQAAIIYMIIICMSILNSFLNGVNEIYDHSAGKRKGTSIKSYVQVVKIFAFFILGILIVSILLNKDLKILMGGLGAIAAILLLVFKDSILGLVAGVQLSGNDLVRIGDWISMPSHNADGNVIEITLNTVKVQNWDKTIATIPTYALVSESFNNWRGMEESGGRRIKRAIHIDMNSVHFCTDEELNTLKKLEYIDEIIEEKNNRGIKITNSGIFRKYLVKYLKERSDINDEMTLLVRHLQPASKGLPIEFYVFSKEQEWATFEDIQAEIMDHIIAILPEFNLKIFQQPTGSDFASIKNDEN